MNISNYKVKQTNTFNYQLILWLPLYFLIAIISEDFSYIILLFTIHSIYLFFFISIKLNVLHALILTSLFLAVFDGGDFNKLPLNTNFSIVPYFGLILLCIFKAKLSLISILIYITLNILLIVSLLLNDIKDIILYIKYLTFFLLCPLIYLSLKNELEKNFIVSFLKSICLFVLIIGFVQIIVLLFVNSNLNFLGQELYYHLRPVGTFAEPTYHSVFATLFLPFFLKDRMLNKKELFEMFIYFSLLFVNLFFAQTRASIIIFVIFIILSRFRLKKQFYIMTIISTFLLFVTSKYYDMAIIPRYIIKFQMKDEGTSIRLRSIMNTYENIKDSLFWGKGFDYVDTIPAHSQKSFNFLISLYSTGGVLFTLIISIILLLPILKYFIKKSSVDRDFMWFYMLTLIVSLFFPFTNTLLGIYILSLSLSIILGVKKSNFEKK